MFRLNIFIHIHDTCHRNTIKLVVNIIFMKEERVREKERKNNNNLKKTTIPHCTFACGTEMAWPGNYFSQGSTKHSIHPEH